MKKSEVRKMIKEELLKEGGLDSKIQSEFHDLIQQEWTKRKFSGKDANADKLFDAFKKSFWVYFKKIK